MSFANAMSKTADKLIKKYGEEITLIYRYDCEYDPSTGGEICSEDTYDVKGKVSNFSISEQSSESINVDDMKVIIQTDIDITKNYTLIYDSKEYLVLNILKTVAQDKTIIQSLQIRAMSKI